MAVRLNAAADYLYSTTAAPTTADHSFAFWFRINTDRNATGVICLIANSGGTEYLSLYLASDGTSLRSNASGNTAAVQALTAGTWYHIALVRSGTSNLVYVNGALVTTHGPVASADFVPASIYIGSNTVDYVDADFYAFKTFNAALSGAQVAQEMHSVRPKAVDVLRGWYPMLAGGAGEWGRDYSGNGVSLSEAGTPANVDGPPVSWGAPTLLLPWVVAGGTTYPQSVAGALTPTGAAVQQGRKGFAAALAPAGALLRTMWTRWTAVLTPAGVLLRRAGKTAVGALAPVGTVARSVARIMSGALTPSGALAAIKTLLRMFTGALAPVGTLARRAGKAAAGSLTPAGALLKRAERVVTGALAPAGSVLKTARRLWAGALAGVGALATQIVTGAQTFYVSVAGALVPSSALLKRAQVGFASALAPTGAFLRRAAKRMSGALTPTGAFAALKVLLRTFTGVLAPAGTVVRRAGRGMAGQLAAAAALVRTTVLRRAGSLAPTSAFTALRTLLRTFAGTLTPAGSVAVARALLLLVVGALTPSGAMVRSASKHISGQLAVAGALARSIGKQIAGALAAAGGLLTQVFGLSNVRLTVVLTDAAVTACALTDRALTVCTVANAALTTCIAGDSALALCTVGDAAATRLTLGDTLYE